MEEIKQKAFEKFMQEFMYELKTNNSYYVLENMMKDYISQAVQAEHDRWASQTANEHDNKIREIALQKQREELIKKITQIAGEKHRFHEDWQDEDCDCDSLYDYKDFIDIINSNN